MKQPVDIATDILDELNGRSGFDGWWDSVDDETRDDILTTMTGIIAEGLAAQPKRKATMSQIQELSTLVDSLPTCFTKASLLVVIGAYHCGPEAEKALADLLEEFASNQLVALRS